MEKGNREAKDYTLNREGERDDGKPR